MRLCSVNLPRSVDMALMDISVIPLDGGRSSYSGFVAELQAILEESGCRYCLNDMATTVEGPAQKLFELALMLHEHSFRAGGKRVYTVMKIDDRRDRNVALGEKVDSVMRKVDSGGQ
uniref:Thiamine-binding protein domain-containing protein n=2 Tax=Chlorobium phaeovibrioides TaxID=1094 RepID=A4SCU3_CHLPM